MDLLIVSRCCLELDYLLLLDESLLEQWRAWIICVGKQERKKPYIEIIFCRRALEANDLVALRDIFIGPSPNWRVKAPNSLLEDVSVLID